MFNTYWGEQVARVLIRLLESLIELVEVATKYISERTLEP